MSEMSTRPRIRSVANPLITAAVGGGAILLGRPIRAAIDELRMPDGAEAHNAAPKVSAPDLVPFAEIRREWRIAERSTETAPPGPRHNPLEAAKISALRTLAAGSCYVNAEAIRPFLEALVAAPTVDRVRQAEQSIVAAAGPQHQRIVIGGLTLACRNAAQATGLTAIDVTPGAIGAVRITATDATGRGIVTEIESDAGGEIAMASEVIGSDGECHALLDVFDAALEREGVRSDSPDRRATGGVCQLAATKAFVARRLRPLTTRTPGAAVVNSARSDRAALDRRRRLNSRTRTRG